MILAKVNKNDSSINKNLRLNQEKNKNKEKKKDGYEEYINPYHNKKRSSNSTIKRDKLKIT